MCFNKESDSNLPYPKRWPLFSSHVLRALVPMQSIVSHFVSSFLMTGRWLGRKTCCQTTEVKFWLSSLLAA